LVNQKRIQEALGDLISWMETWKDRHGAYNGFVVHRTEAKRMGLVHDTAWTQSALIRGYGNLYRKSSEARWQNAMIEAADLFAACYDPDTGRIHHTGHEDDRFQSLVSCALGVCALLSIVDLVDLKRRKRYIKIVCDHFSRYWMDVLWVETEGAFKFAEVDYYSQREDRFVVNFNTMAAEAFIGAYRATGENEFLNQALCIGDWLKERWNHAQKFNEKLLKGRVTIADDPLSEWMPPGAFSYQFTKCKRDPDNDVVLYSGLSLRGLYALYSLSRDKGFADIIRSQSAYILAMRDPETRLFYHTAKNGRIEKKPLFVAGAGMILTGLYEVQPLLGDHVIPEDTLESILDRVYANGSYPGFIGMNDTGFFRRDSGGVVWEDVAASMNWNAQLFEYLTLLVEEPQKTAVNKISKSTFIFSRRFIYSDMPGTVQIISWWPPRSWGIYLYTKKRVKAWVSFYPKQIFGHLRLWFKRITQ